VFGAGTGRGQAREVAGMPGAADLTCPPKRAALSRLVPRHQP
jgi:hypothetical protein